MSRDASTEDAYPGVSGDADAALVALVATWHDRYAERIEAFVRGMTRDAELAVDVTQTVFAKAIEQCPDALYPGSKQSLVKSSGGEAADADTGSGDQLGKASNEETFAGLESAGQTTDQDEVRQDSSQEDRSADVRQSSDDGSRTDQSRETARNKDDAERLESTPADDTGDVEGDRSHSDARAWLFTVARNEALSRLRRQGVERRTIAKLAVPSPSVRAAANVAGRTDGEDDILITAERAEAVRVAVESLKENEQKLVWRHWRDGWTFARIAEVDNEPLGTVLSRAHRTVAKLREKLKEIGGD